jgi:hypothetical protein
LTLLNWWYEMRTLVLEINDIALAAYMKMSGCEFIAYDGSKFKFKNPSERSIDDWSLEYTNSCCCSHDNQLLQLRNMVRRHNNS